MTFRTTALALVFMGLTLTGCRSSRIPAPTSELAAASLAVEQADQMGAEVHAPLEIRQARQKLDQAQRLLRSGDNKRARLLIEKAKVDAELAEAKALATKSQKAVDELQQTINTLKEEIARNSNN